MTQPRTSARTALVEASITALARHPGASLEEIAKQAGVGRATLYRHFGSRSGLMLELAKISLEETDRALAGISLHASATEILRATLEAVVPLGDRFHFLSRELEVMKDPEIAAGVQRQLDELGALVRAIKQEGRLAADVPDAWVVAAIDALVYAAWTAVADGSVARRDAPGLAFRTILNGLGPG